MMSTMDCINSHKSALRRAGMAFGMLVTVCLAGCLAGCMHGYDGPSQPSNESRFASDYGGRVRDYLKTLSDDDRTEVADVAKSKWYERADEWTGVVLDVERYESRRTTTDRYSAATLQVKIGHDAVVIVQRASSGTSSDNALADSMNTLQAGQWVRFSGDIRKTRQTDPSGLVQLVIDVDAISVIDRK